MKYSYHGVVASCLMLVILSIFLGDYPKKGHLFHKCVQIGSWNHPTWGCNNKMPNLIWQLLHGMESRKPTVIISYETLKIVAKKWIPSQIARFLGSATENIMEPGPFSTANLPVGVHWLCHLTMLTCEPSKKTLLLSIESWFFNRDP